MEQDEGARDERSLADAYAAWRASTLGQITDALEQDVLIELIRPSPGLLILDVGCGDGAFAVDLAARGADVVGVDASREMIAAARRRAESAGSAATFRTGRAEALPFDSHSFDVVVGVTVLCFVHDPAAAMREMARVVRPGGAVVIGELGRWSGWAAIRRVKGWLGASIWSTVHFWSVQELQKLTSGAGLVRMTARGAVFYPPVPLLARLARRLDPVVGRFTTLGAAFIALVARKPGNNPQYAEGGVPHRVFCKGAPFAPGRSTQCGTRQAHRSGRPGPTARAAGTSAGAGAASTDCVGASARSSGKRAMTSVP